MALMARLPGRPHTLWHSRRHFHCAIYKPLCLFKNSVGLLCISDSLSGRRKRWSRQKAQMESNVKQLHLHSHFKRFSWRLSLNGVQLNANYSERKTLLTADRRKNSGCRLDSSTPSLTSWLRMTKLISPFFLLQVFCWENWVTLEATESGSVRKQKIISVRY